MSTWVRIHPTHILAGFGEIATPHWQHNLQKKTFWSDIIFLKNSGYKFVIILVCNSMIKLCCLTSLLLPEWSLRQRNPFFCNASKLLWLFFQKLTSNISELEKHTWRANNLFLLWFNETDRKIGTCDIENLQNDNNTISKLWSKAENCLINKN